jgi:orotate phosphoribosyltransferase
MSPEGLSLIGQLGLEALQASGWKVDSVGGLTLGADPVAYAIAYTSALKGMPIRAFTVRKQTKAHGMGKLIEGPFQIGDHSAIVEDVITTGSSALQAAEAVANAGGVIAGVLALVDREEGGRDVLEARGFNVIALTRASDILAQMPE